jgi:hypothetical protein
MQKRTAKRRERAQLKALARHRLLLADRPELSLDEIEEDGHEDEITDGLSPEAQLIEQASRTAWRNGQGRSGSLLHVNKSCRQCLSGRDYENMIASNSQHCGKP